MEPLFVVNSKRELPKNSHTIEKTQMKLNVRSVPFYLEGVYVFDKYERITLADMELEGKPAAWLNFFSTLVWPTLGIDTSNSEELVLSDGMFLEILYQRLWPTTKENLTKLFEERDIGCIWQNETA